MEQQLKEFKGGGGGVRGTSAAPGDVSDRSGTRGGSRISVAVGGGGGGGAPGGGELTRRAGPAPPGGQARARLDADQSVFRIYKGVKCFDFSKKKNVIITGGAKLDTRACVRASVCSCVRVRVCACEIGQCSTNQTKGHC